jgi:hypothetical protein
MGEAKRRKKLDPNYGIYNPTITIAKSEVTNNYLVLMDEICVDSTIHIEEAEAIKEWVEQEQKVNPLKRYEVKPGGLHPWLVSSKRYDTYPKTTAEILVMNIKTKAYETQLFTT